MTQEVELKIKAFWDSEAEVFVAESDDVPGLVTEASTFEALVEKLKVMIPELLAENTDHVPRLRDDAEPIPFSVMAEVRASASRRAS